MMARVLLILANQRTPLQGVVQTPYPAVMLHQGVVSFRACWLATQVGVMTDPSNEVSMP